LLLKLVLFPQDLLYQILILFILQVPWSSGSFSFAPHWSLATKNNSQICIGNIFYGQASSPETASEFLWP